MSGEALKADADHIADAGKMVSDDLVERLRAAVSLGDATGARGNRPTNIYNLAAEAAARISAVEAERDAALSLALTEAGGQSHERELREIAERNRDAGLENFLTMQGAAATLLKRATKAEARNAVLEAALKSIGNTYNDADVLRDIARAALTPEPS